MKLKAVFFVLIFAALAVAGPVSHFGYLKKCAVSGKGQICGSLTGTTPVMVKGPSLFWSHGDGTAFYKREVVDWFVDYMEIGIIRAAMSIEYNKEYSGLITDDCQSCQGYLSNKSNAKTSVKNLIKKIVDAAIANDIYVIVDWHSHNAQSEQAGAVEFFRDMANDYPNTPNIIWEIYNEPVGASANQIKTYSDAVISAIRGTGNENLIVIGSKNYAQEPANQASQAAPTDSKNNLAYSFHFYTNQNDVNHQFNGNIRSQADAARNAGNAIFATEWGSVNADGAGTPGNHANWITFLDTSNTSGCYWNASNITANNQASNIFTSSTNVATLVASTSSNFATRLSSSGQVFQTYMGTKKWNSYSPASANPRGKDFSASVIEGNSVTWNSTDLGLTNSATVKSAEIIDGTGSVSFTANSITYTSQNSGSDHQAYIRYVVTGGGKDIKQRIVVNITGTNPVLPKQNPIEVSHRVPTDIKLNSNLPAQVIVGQWNSLDFSGASIISTGGGTAVLKDTNTITFTPPASIKDIFDVTEFELEYKVRSNPAKGGNGMVSTQTVTLHARNFTPVLPSVPEPGINWSNGGTFPNTAPFEFNPYWADPDGDQLYIVAYYLHPDYPGTLETNADKTFLIYTPEPGKKGTIRFLLVVTDGHSVSNVGGYRITLSGDGTDINVGTTPTEIPGYDPTFIKPVYAATGGASLQNLGSGRLLVNFAQSGQASLSVYSISGARVATLMSGFASSGNQEFNLGNLQKGVYIVRLKQGSEVKTLKIVR